MCASLLKGKHIWNEKEGPLSGCSFFPRVPDGVNYLCLCIVTITLLCNNTETECSNITCGANRSRSEFHQIFKQWLRSAGGFIMQGCHQGPAIQDWTDNKSFVPRLGKNQWGPSKYGYHSPSIPQQHNAKQYWVALIVQICRPCIIAVTATVSHSETTTWLLNKTELWH